MPKALPKELKEVVKSMYLAGLLPQAIASETGVAARLISKWATKGQWGVAVATTKEALTKRGKASLARQAAVDIAASSASVRNALASTLEKQAAVLARENPKAKDLANTRTGQGQAAVAKAIAETAEKVFGWGEESAPGMVLSIHLTAEPASKATPCSVIDVQAIDDSPKSLPLQDRQLNDLDIVRSDIEQGAEGVTLPAEPGSASPGQAAPS